MKKSVAPKTLELNLYTATLQEDIKNGTHITFDNFLVDLARKAGLQETNILEHLDADYVQLDVGLVSPSNSVYRVAISSDVIKGLRMLSIWNVGLNGFPISNTFSYLNFSEGEHPSTYIRGSTVNSIEGFNLDIEPTDFSAKIDEVLGNLEPENWRVVYKAKEED